MSGEEITYRYDAFGTLIEANGEADNSITYAGYQYDVESGLYYLNARYYDSTTARFLTEDTYAGQANDPLSLNRYTYCANNPLRYTDPSGHFFGAVLRFVGGAVIGGGIEFITQKFIEKREKVDWKAVLYEGVVGGVTAVIGGVGGAAGKVGKTEKALKTVAKGALKTGVKEGIGGFVEDVGYQVFVDEKRLDNLDFWRLFQTMGIAGISGVFGAAADFISDYRRNAKVKRAPVMVEVEDVHYECFNHIPNCKNHENNIRVVTKEKKWEIQEVLEYNGTDRSFMDYLRDYLGENPSAKTQRDAKIPRKLNLQFFAEGADIKAKKHAVDSAFSEKTITNSVGQEVTRKYVKDQDALLRMAEEAAGGDLDKFKEIKPGWYLNKEETIKIEWNPEGHSNTNEGPHVVVRHINEVGGWNVIDKYFIEGGDYYHKK